MQGSESDRDNLFEAFRGNLMKLQELAIKKTFKVSETETVTVEVHFGGDEAWLRFLIGLKKSVCLFFSHFTKSNL